MGQPLRSKRKRDIFNHEICRKDDTISPKLFTILLGEVFQELEWKIADIKTDVEYIQRLACDVVTFRHYVESLQSIF